MGNIIMRFVVLLVDTHYDTSTALAMFRYNCDALDFIEKQQRIMGDSNMEFTIEPLEPGHHTITTGPGDEPADGGDPWLEADDLYAKESTLEAMDAGDTVDIPFDDVRRI